MSAVIEVEKVYQQFRLGFLMKKFEVLRDVSLTVEKNSIFGILGANGAGKTSLMNLMVGLREPFSGSVRIHGVSSALPAARAQLGYLPERPYFYEHLTGKRLLEYSGNLCGMSGAKLRQRADELLAQLGLKDAADMELKRYSKGMLQRAGIAQALIHDPSILILDEPMSGLDPFGRREIRMLIEDLGRQGKTVIFSSHILEDIEVLCDTVAIIKKGKLMGCGKPESFVENGSLGTEIVVRGVESARIRKEVADPIEISPLAGGLKIVVPVGSDTRKILNSLLQLGAEIVDVTQLRVNLEGLLGKISDRRDEIQS